MDNFPIDILVVGEAEVFRSGTYQEVPCPFTTSPSQYLDYARLDLAEESERGNLNAFHNAKRSIDCQTDWIIWNHGLPGSPQSPRSKFALLEEVAASPPKILTRLIQQRNLLEHEYESTERTVVEDAVDIAELYVRATGNLTNERFEEWELWSPMEKIGGIFDPVYNVDGTLGTGFELRKLKLLAEYGQQAELSPAGFKYRLFKSSRNDRLNPQEILWPGYKGPVPGLSPEMQATLDEYLHHGSQLGSDRIDRLMQQIGYQPIPEGILTPKEKPIYMSLVRAIIHYTAHPQFLNLKS